MAWPAFLLHDLEIKGTRPCFFGQSGIYKPAREHWSVAAEQGRSWACMQYSWIVIGLTWIHSRAWSGPTP